MIFRKEYFNSGQYVFFSHHTAIKITCLMWNSNMTSFFRFVNKWAIYRLGIISLAHVLVHTFKPGNKLIK